MRRLIVSDAAIADVRAITEYIADRAARRDAANELVERLLLRCQRLAQLPGQLGTARPELAQDLRSVPQGSYIIFFRYIGDEALEIINILSARRDAGTHYHPEIE